MRNGLFSGLGKVLDAGAAWLQHTNFARQALAAPPHDLPRLLSQYARGLSDAGFTGFKMTLGLLMANEPAADRKLRLQRMLEGADAARRGEPPAEAPPVLPSPSGGAGDGFDQDLARMSGWYDQLDQAGRQQALIDHVGTLSPHGYQRWCANLSQMSINIAERIRKHESRENSAWGGSTEDRMAYQMARLRTGQRDPAHARQLATYVGVRDLVAFLLAASQRLWTERQQKESTAMPPEKAKPDSAAIKAAIEQMSRTGQYPGGVEQLRSDLAALVASGEADQVLELLNKQGANEGGRETLNIAEHYRPGEGLFDLRWPLGFTLPMAFDQLDRPTQFSVLFGEWSRREMEGQYSLGQGDVAGALAIFQECLARAQQIDVPELVARSQEGLASVANRNNQRSVEREHLRLAVTARGRT